MLSKLFGAVTGAIVSVAVLYGLFHMGGELKAQPTSLLPAITGVAIPTTAGGTSIISANPSRRYIEICNASVTNDLWIMPTSTSAAALPTLVAGGVGAYLVSQKPAAGATIGTVMNCYRTPAGALGAGSAWLGLAVTGTANVTVYEY